MPPLEDRWPRGFRPIRPATDTTVTGTTVENAMDKASDTNLATPGAGSATIVENKTRSFSMHIHEEAEIPTQPETRTRTQPDMIDFSDFNELFDVSEPPTMTPASHNLQTAHLPTVPDIISPRLLSLDPSMVFPGLVMPDSMDFNLGTEVLEPQLSQRSRSLQQGSMTAKMIFSRMSEYGRMMADAKTLPPFIHPPCCLGSGDECSPNAAHTCLPEVLAYNGFDEDLKLQALQAALVCSAQALKMTKDDSFRTELRNTKVLEGPFPDLDFDTFPETPHDAFKLWFHEAVSAGVKEPHAMTLSTVDESGYPDARVLILKNVDARGWHFAVKADSPKGKQLHSNGRAALTFYWPQVARQIRLRGRAIALSDEESAIDFQSRPLASRISAVASKQSEILSGRSALTRNLAETEAKMAEDPLMGVNKWRVYAVLPDVVEFWQGSDTRLHQRLQYMYMEDEDKWQRNLLWP
ncbi:pyridoxamine 5'-phosphate oxidase [Penicillium tannophilum]|nr:pyridoxamine 5'-phosphate oxidase [Penicillium tannophilum]